uniref:TUB like protein 2 n=1 Tax=Aotus nancymaae TaxID=37293 RepID=A0A2K5CNX0_AOTNA
MSQENDAWRRDILGHELAAVRLQTLEQQVLCSGISPLALFHSPGSTPPDLIIFVGSLYLLSGLGNPFFLKNLSEAHLLSGLHSAVGTVSRGGDSSGQSGPLTPRTEAVFWNLGLQSPSFSLLPDSSNSELEEVSVENGSVSPPLFKPTPIIPRRCWQPRQLRGTRAEGESESQDVGHAYKAPKMGPNTGMDSDRGHENLALQKEEDLEKKIEASESTGTNSSAAINKELSKALKGEGGTGGDHMNCEASFAISSPCPRLGEDMKAYVLRPLLQGIRMQCYINRDNRGVDKGLFPLYYLYLENPNGVKLYLKKKRKRKRKKERPGMVVHACNLSILDRSNALGTKFTIFDNGVNPDREHLIRDTARIRRELGAVCYDTNALGFLGPREMIVVLPETDSQNQIISVQPLTEQESLLSRIQRGDNQGLLVLHNKTPSWNHKNRVFVLDFHGRVTMTSVKNFQIMHPKDPERLVLQFGRVAPDTFTMDFGFPLSPLQAFAICLSSFN